MNSLEELNRWINEVKSLEVNDENIDILNNFIRSSPEKIANKLGVEKEFLVKGFQKHKKEVHNKIIIFNRVNKLKKRKLELVEFRYNGVSYQTKICVCTKYFKIKSNAKFYPSITYLYCELQLSKSSTNESLVVFAENQKVYMTGNEFNENFIDMREFKINSIINSL
jgi:hypothetical protein